MSVDCISCIDCHKRHNMDCNVRPDCQCVICRTGSVLAHGVATYCCQLYETLPVCQCKVTTQLREFEPITGPQVPPHAFLNIVRYILPPDQFRSYVWHIPFRQPQLLKIQLLDSSVSFAVDYLFGFFHVCDQLLDVPASVWIHFVWLLHRICSQTDSHVPSICTCTFIPIVWTTLMVASKLHDDHHWENPAFVKAINFYASTPSTTTQSQSPSYQNRYLQTKTVVPISCTTLEELNLLEELLLVDLFQFNLLSYHDRTDWPLFTCWCANCQPFHSVYAACSSYVRQHPLSMFRRPTGVWYCPTSQDPYSMEFKEFIEIFYLRLRQTYGLQMQLKSAASHTIDEEQRACEPRPRPNILKRPRPRKQASQATTESTIQSTTQSITTTKIDPLLFFTNPMSEPLYLFV